MSKAENKIRVIDLLNKIANGEEIPKKIKSEDKEFYFKEDETSIDYLYRTDKNGNGWLVVQDLALNDEVEILEDNTEEIEEIKNRSDNYFNMLSEEAKIKWLNKYQQENKDKINELVKAVNKFNTKKE